MNQDLAKMALEDDIADGNEAAPETSPCRSAGRISQSETAILLDIDGSAAATT